jgi:hypothetical protein
LNKIVASTDKTLGLPIIADNFIKSFIEEEIRIIYGLYIIDNIAFLYWNTKREKIIKAESHDGLEAKAWWMNVPRTINTMLLKKHSN